MLLLLSAPCVLLLLSRTTTMSASAALAAVSTTRAVAAVKGAKKWPHTSPTLQNAVDNASNLTLHPDHDLPSWSSDQIRDAASRAVMLTWAPGKSRYQLPIITHGEGVYLFDDSGNKYIDWTSQAMCTNIGYSIPPAVQAATAKQMDKLAFIYGGLGMCEIRARLSRLMSEILPGDLQGMVFPSSGAEANEAAIMMARRYTGKYKVINWYRSYHGGTANSLQATGDFRRWYGMDASPGFVKSFNPFPLFWEFGGDNEEEKMQMALNMLEEQILNEGPDSIALLQIESIVGSGGVIVPPKGYMQGVRAICDKYDILLQFDEVMAGFGRTGELFGFQNFDGVLPDILTSAKGLSSAALPISMTACRKHIMDAFEEKPLGWGSTYQAHPVSMACAYENIKYLIKEDVIGRVKRLAPIFESRMKAIAEKHPCIKQYRSIGFFGCFDTHLPETGAIPQLQHTAIDSAFLEYKKVSATVRLLREKTVSCTIVLPSTGTSSL